MDKLPRDSPEAIRVCAMNVYTYIVTPDCQIYRREHDKVTSYWEKLEDKDIPPHLQEYRFRREKAA